MNHTGQPGKSTPIPASVPDESKSVINISHHLSFNPNLTSSSVQPRESQPNDKLLVPVPNENVVPEHAPHSRERGVSDSRQDTYGSVRGWINKLLSGDHSPDLMFPNMSYAKSLQEISIHHISRLRRPLPSSLPTMPWQSREVLEFWTLLRR